MTKATFGAGCFWGVEAQFREIPGVLETQVGYAGGTTSNPTYKQVCSGSTGHAEVVEVEYDPSRLSYDQLLAHFWEMHDATRPGDQYRSVIFFHDPEQERLALESRARQPTAVITEIQPVPQFWRAEEYHQRYFEK